MKEEETVRQQRKDEFFSQSFAMDAPGAIFPLSWKSPFENACTEQKSRPTLIPRPDYKDKASELLQSALRGCSPIFDKCTEEGMRFRIYSLGHLEVRSIQEMESQELVGAVFSTQPPPKAAGPRMELHLHERFVKASLLVERAAGLVTASCPAAYRRYYVVLETAAGTKVLLERLRSGEAIWEPAPVDLEDRISLAKVLVCAECRAGLFVGDMKSYQLSMTGSDGHASPKTCKHYAHKVFARATGVPAARSFSTSMMPMGGYCAANQNTTFTPMQSNALDSFVARCRQITEGKARAMEKNFGQR